MKIINLFAAISIILFVAIHTTAQTTYVPDNNFEQALIHLGYDSGIPDDYVPTANISSLTSLNINGKNISDLTGIEAFAALSELNCGNNKLSSLNLNGNAVLKELSCFNNQITSLDPGSNPNLSELVCYNNLLTNLDVSANPVLLKLNCSNNRITSLDLSSNTSINYINCSNNDLNSLNLKNGNNVKMTGGNYYDTGIDCRNNPDLFCIQVDNVENAISYSTWYEDFWAEYNLNCSGFTLEKAYIPDDNLEQALINLGYDYGNPDDYVPMTSIKKATSVNINNKNISDLTGIEAFTALNTLYCNSNKLTACNFSSNANLVYIDCSANQLTQLNVSGNSQLQTLYCQYNALVNLDINSNTNLIRIYCNNNQLSGLDLRNVNSNIKINTINNPNLFCIEVNDEAAANNNYNWIKSAYTAYSENCSLYITEMTFVPDDNFEQALINLGYDAGPLNDSVPTIAIKSKTYLDVAYNFIKDLTGLEDFVALEQLNCYNNQITTINLSSNAKLKVLKCFENKIPVLNVMSNPLLTELNCNFNNLSELDISSNPLITKIDARYNQLTSVNLRNGNNANMSCDLRFNPDLSCIEVDDPEASYHYANWYKNGFAAYTEDCSNYKPEMVYIPDDNFEKALIASNLDFGLLNDSVPMEAIQQLKSLDISYNNISDLTGIEEFINLEQLACHYNKLTKLNLSANTHLRNLVCYNNKITNLDLSSNVLLTSLNARNNQLTTLNLKNNNNGNMSIDVSGNPDLSCIQVDNADLSYTYTNWYKNPYAAYSEDCDTHRTEMTYIPDDVFEQALIGLGYDSGELNDSVPTHAISNVTALSLGYYGIKDLTGIADFVNLTELSCYDNQLTSLDLSSNVKLKKLYCQNNRLNSLDVSSNVILEDLDCSNNEIIDLNLGNIQTLIYLYAANNFINDLYLNANTKLGNIFINDNELKELNLSNLTVLNYLNCQNNRLVSLNLKNGNNQNMSLDAENNFLFCIEVDNPASTYIHAYWNVDAWANFSEDCLFFPMEMTYVPDDNFEQALIELGCDFNELNDSVPTSIIENVRKLDISSKEIKDLTGIEAFISLQVLNCDNNQIDSINLSPFPELYEFQCWRNNIKHLDLHSNVNLLTLETSENPISSLNLSSNTKLEILSCSNNNLTKLDLSSNPALHRIDLDHNQLYSLNLKNGNNKIIQYMLTYDNPNLTCIEVDDPVFSAAAYNWHEDLGTSYSLDCGYDFQKIYIPDDNFEQALIDLGYDSGELDDSVYMANIININNLEIQNKNISSLQGIESFESLYSIDCSNNNITKLNLNSNKQLTSVMCRYNQLSTLSVDSLAYLELLDCAINELTSIKTGNNTILSSFDCSNNKISALNLTSNIELTSLICNANLLTELDLHLNPRLTELHCGDNKLLSLDLTTNNELTTLYCYRNNLSELNIKNGNNWHMTSDGNEMKAYENPNLTCIQVDNAADATSYTDWTKDSGARYSEDCSVMPAMTFIPDDNFEQALIDLGYDSGSLNDSVPTDNIKSIQILLLQDRHISDLSGIEDFRSLTFLDCSGNNITYLDLRNSAELDSVYCSANQLTYLGISTNTKLKSLICEFNQLTSLEVNNNVELVQLSCSYNKLDSLNLDSLKFISRLSCFNNKITTLRLNGCSNLTVLNCSQNQITSLDLQNYPNLQFLDCSSNSLYELDLSYNTNLNILSADWNKLRFVNLKNGNNANMTKVLLRGNSDLSCIQVDKANVLNESKGWYKDEWAVYSENCGAYGVGVPLPEYNALVDFYNNFNGENWNYNQNWLDTVNHSVADWQGITVENGNVTAIDLSGLNLEGDISGYFNDLDSLKWLNLSNNNFSGELSALFGKGDLPKSLVSENSTLDYLNIANNHFTFADLEPDATRLNSIAEFIYAPQALIGMKKDTSVYRGENITLEFPDYIPGSSDYYIWLKNGAMSVNSNMLVYTVENAAYADSGFYTLAVTNVLFPGLMLQSDTINLKVLTSVGNSEISVRDEIKLYPNPADEKIFIGIKSLRTNLKIFNYAGMLVYEEKACQPGWLDVKAFSPGIYIFRFENEVSGMINKKVVLE